MSATKHNDGGPAFPCPVPQRASDGTPMPVKLATGLTLRDYFAGQALQALVSRDGDDSAYGMDMVKARPILAYEYADAMIAAREVEP